MQQDAATCMCTEVMMWRNLALQIACQLPKKRAEALAVLDETRRIVNLVWNNDGCRNNCEQSSKIRLIDNSD